MKDISETHPSLNKYIRPLGIHPIAVERTDKDGETHGAVIMNLKVCIEEDVQKYTVDKAVLKEAISKTRKSIANRTLPCGKYPDFDNIFMFLKKELGLEEEE
jgi:hypothetical protein